MGRFKSKCCWEEGPCEYKQCSTGHRHWEKVSWRESEMGVNLDKLPAPETGHPQGLCIFCELLQQNSIKFLLITAHNISTRCSYLLLNAGTCRDNLCMGTSLFLAGNGFCIKQTGSKCSYLQTSTCLPSFLGSSSSTHLQQFCHQPHRSCAALKIQY